MNLSDIVSQSYKVYLNQTKGAREFGGFFSNLMDKWSGSGLTDAEREANAWTAFEKILSLLVKRN